MRRLAALLALPALLVAHPALAQRRPDRAEPLPPPATKAETNIQVQMPGVNIQLGDPNGPSQTALQPAGGRNKDRTEERFPDHRRVTEPSEDGSTELTVLEPEGAVVHVWDGKRELLADDVPATVAVPPKAGFVRVRIEFQNAGGVTWERKIEVKKGRVTRLWVVPPQVVAPQPPVIVQPVQPAQPVRPQGPAGQLPMEPARFAALKSAIAGEDFANRKVESLKTAAGREWFTCAQLGELLDLYDFENNKLEVTQAVRPHLIDPENHFTLNPKFTFSATRSKVDALFR